MNKYFALIPARSGSIRIKNKNQSKIRNLSLLEWAIKYGIKQEELSQVFVSTDLNINLDFSNNEKIKLISRPKDLADSKSTLLDVIRHLINTKNLDLDDNLVLLLPTAPLRVSSDLKCAINLFEKNNRQRSVMSITPHTHPPELSWTIEQDNLLPFIKKNVGKTFSQKQKYNQRYYFDECILLDKISSWLRMDRSLFGHNPLPQITPAERGIPIDYPIHLKFCNYLFPPYDERRSCVEW